MSTRSKQYTIGAIVVAVIAVMGYAGDVLDAWPKVGWKTPAAHAADIAELRAETVGEVKEFRDEWRCDEYDEELREKLRELQADPDNTDLQEDVRRLRDKLDKYDCSRFDE